MSEEQDNIIARTLLETSGNQMDKGATIQISRNSMGPMGDLKEIANDLSYIPRVDRAGAGTDPELEEQVEINTGNITTNTGGVTTNAGGIAANGTGINNLITIINDRNPDEQPIDPDLIIIADTVWTFKFTVDGPGGEPNDVRANFYQVGNQLFCDYTSTNNGTGPNQANNYLKDSTGSTQSTAINIKLADNGTTYTGNNMVATITPGDYYKMIFVGGQWYINLYTTPDI